MMDTTNPTNGTMKAKIKPIITIGGLEGLLTDGTASGGDELD